MGSSSSRGSKTSKNSSHSSKDALLPFDSGVDLWEAYALLDLKIPLEIWKVISTHFTLKDLGMFSLTNQEARKLTSSIITDIGELDLTGLTPKSVEQMVAGFSQLKFSHLTKLVIWPLCPENLSNLLTPGRLPELRHLSLAKPSAAHLSKLALFLPQLKHLQHLGLIGATASGYTWMDSFAEAIPPTVTELDLRALQIESNTLTLGKKIMALKNLTALRLGRFLGKLAFLDMGELNTISSSMTKLLELELCGVSINTEPIESFTQLTKLSLISDKTDGCWSYFTGYTAASKMTNLKVLALASVHDSLYRIPHFKTSILQLTALESLNLIGFEPSASSDWHEILSMPRLRHVLVNDKAAKKIADDEPSRYAHVEYMQVQAYHDKVNSIYGYFEKNTMAPPPRDFTNDWY